MKSPGLMLEELLRINNREHGKILDRTVFESVSRVLYIIIDIVFNNLYQFKGKIGQINACNQGLVGIPQSKIRSPPTPPLKRGESKIQNGITIL
jgi:hypothetical protein